MVTRLAMAIATPQTGDGDDVPIVAGPDPWAAASPRAFSIGTMVIGTQALRVGRQAGTGRGLPLVIFNGLGANIELLEPIARRMPGRELITFDIPGVGHSPLPRRPYRLKGIVALTARVLDHFGHHRCDVMGLSWGGAAAQQFARSQSERCRRLILCATAPGVLMVPGRPGVLLKLATPRRFLSPEYAQRVAGDIYGGDFRRDPALAAEVFRHVRWQSRLGYYLQLAAAAGWTSIHWLHELEQPTLVMAGADDPIVPLPNARLMCRLIPQAELEVFDCGHLFLLTRTDRSVRAIEEFLDRP
jgi:poly(3-hydroxyoctanoate) depolymerase